MQPAIIAGGSRAVNCCRTHLGSSARLSTFRCSCLIFIRSIRRAVMLPATLSRGEGGLVGIGRDGSTESKEIPNCLPRAMSAGTFPALNKSLVGTSTWRRGRVGEAQLGHSSGTTRVQLEHSSGQLEHSSSTTQAQVGHRSGTARAQGSVE